MASKKLTKPQVDLLRESITVQGAYAVPEYKPVQKLLALGFIRERCRDKYGGSCWWVATEAGRKALAQEGKKP